MADLVKYYKMKQDYFRWRIIQKRIENRMFDDMVQFFIAGCCCSVIGIGFATMIWIGK